MNMEKFICIHGHFYQPPRENPWLESVELQDSASPYHDWNERITAECYAPNATARIFDADRRIARIVNNYARISFNFGPTLLTWLKEKMPDIHEALIEADKLSQKKFSGHGSALAQVYNHMILPLGNRPDKYTQVLWGIRDFEFRFGRKPEGMWLSETAADSETFDVLAELGIKFTILSPFQASRVRKIGERSWRDVNGGRIDPTRPYLVRLRSGKSIVVFFYDAPISRAIAFEGLLESGEKLATRLVSAFSDRRNHDQLVHIATDGESYGHHHRHGEMALAYALQYIESEELARVTNYGEYLENHPPTHEVQIHEKTAWSCSHGVGRWMENCGCLSGGHTGWNQLWRAPLRQALDWLRDQITPAFESKAKEYLKDPWAARNNYIEVILNRAPEVREGFYAQHAVRELSESDKITVLKLMELQRHAMLMYTSCGWFFDELSGIETVQVLQYAGRVVQLANEFSNRDLEPEFLDLLAKALSNIREHCDGRCIYQNFVKPAMVDWNKAVAHYAISSLFENYSERTHIFVYDFADEHRQLWSVGKAKLVAGRTRVTFEITQESALMSYAVLYMGEHNFVGGVRKHQSEEAYGAVLEELRTAFDQADFPQVIRLIDHHFGEPSYSLRFLFKDEQRRILDQILDSTREDLENRYRLITERYTPLMRFLRELWVPLPPALQTAADFILHSDIRRIFASNLVDLDRLRSLLEEARGRNLDVVDADLSYIIKNKMEALMLQLAAQPKDLTLLKNIEGLAGMVMPLPLGLNLWKVQNTYYGMLQSVFPELHNNAKAGDKDAQAWTQEFLALGDRLEFAVKHLQP